MTLVRFAPSPTGLLHVGNARTAVVNWLFAHKTGGKFFLRIDDTDTERSKPEYEAAIIEDLAWLGLTHDLFARQMERTDAHQSAAEKLKASGRLYPAYETADELDRRRKRQIAMRKAPVYDRAALALTEDDRAKLEAEGRKPHWRFKLSQIKVKWRDLIRGEVEIDTAHLSDPVLIREDGRFLYTLPSVADDIDFAVTHIVRGEDHVTNTAAQIEIFEALEARVPEFAHFPLLIGSGGEALSKRIGSLSLREIRENGMEPLALDSYLAKTGTSDPVELRGSLEELAREFDFAKIGRAPAHFDPKELEGLNAKLLHGLSYDVVAARLWAIGITGGGAFWDAVKPNLTRLSDAADLATLITGPLTPVIEDASFAAKAAELLPAEPWNEETWGAWTKAVGAAAGAKGRALFHPLRLALTGREHGPELKKLLPLIGRAKALSRLNGYRVTQLRLYNTLSRTKEDFAPLDPANVRMYVCGPTVYDYAHIGNARPAIVFDVLFRLLRHIYGAGHVTYVRNITDIDDKINARAQERAKGGDVFAALRELTEKTYGIYREDVMALGCLEPTLMPRATENVSQMIAMTSTLIKAGYAYAAEGHVLFRVKTKADYGKLARRSVDDMLAGARVDVAPYKEDPMDFVLWKPSDAATPGWESPWGRGRPGWHLECSAMIEATMGETIDIHGGGIDLVFPHHENEIAQSEGAHRGHPLARFWMHNGFLNVEGEKMSKSLGNFVTINELLKDWPGEVLRFNMLRSHYRQPMDWTVAGMNESWKTLEKWYAVTEPLADPPVGEAFLTALCDDLNTPQAIAELHKGSDHELAAGLGLLGFSNVQLRIAVKTQVDEVAIADAIAARNAARKAKDFKESDRIRDELLAKGIVLKDGPGGTTWEVKR